MLTRTDRWLTIAVWLMAMGLIVGIPSGFLTYLLWPVLMGAAPTWLEAVPRLLPVIVFVGAAALALVGGLAFLAGSAIHFVRSSLSPSLARVDYASFWAILACLALAITLASLLQLVVLLAPALAGGVSPRVASGGGSLTPNLLILAIYSLELSLLLVLWIRIIRTGVITWQDMGLNSWQLSNRLLIGVGAGIAVFVLAGIIEFALAQFGVEQTQVRQFEPVKSASALQFALLLIGGAVVTPLVEEAFFRGYVFKSIFDTNGALWAYLFSAALFAGAHVNWQAFLPILVIGLVLAAVFRYSNSIIPSAVAHGINNGIAFTALYVGMT